jgi:Domain of unknown function (DUF4186)
MSSESPQPLKPLDIKCTSTNCSNNLHCFLATKKLIRQGLQGRCRSCRAELVDWAGVHRRDPSDTKYTFEALRYELIRHHFWHIPVSRYALNYARRKGKKALKAAAEKQIGKAVGNISHPREGRQTPRETNPTANVIHYAQHATASCCRRCLEEWHGIPRGRVLTPEEIGYLTELAMLYVEARVPDLGEEPVHVPSMRHKGQIESPKPEDERMELPHAS